MIITIDQKLKDKCPNIALGCIIAEVEVTESNDELKEILKSFTKQFEFNYGDVQLSTLGKISAGRAAYRSLGKDPTKYRISSEALARRIVKGKGLYEINNVVDINNLISLTSLNPVCAYDLDKIVGNVRMTYEDVIEDYEGISRGILNVANMPIVADDIGIFGSTTSDSERAKITENTKRLFMKIVSFTGAEGLEKSIESTCDLLETFCNGTITETKIVF